MRLADRHITDAVDANTVATKASWADAKAVISADRAARGITGGKVSTSLAPRFNFLRQNQSGGKDAAVAAAIAQGFERGATPLFRNTRLIPKSIKELERDQHQLLKHGDTKNAALIGKDIDRLKAEQSRRQAATTKAVKALDTKVVVQTAVKFALNGRILLSDLTRYATVVQNGSGVLHNGAN
jgi:hypothetical protein